MPDLRYLGKKSTLLVKNPYQICVIFIIKEAMVSIQQDLCHIFRPVRPVVCAPAWVLVKKPIFQVVNAYQLCNSAALIIIINAAVHGCTEQ